MPFTGTRNKGGRPKGARNKATVEITVTWRKFFESPVYQASLKKRMLAGKAPHMETYLGQLCYGRPIERHELDAHVEQVTTVVHEHHET